MGYFRYPRSKNEMTQYYATTVNEYKIPIKIRGKRQPLHLPNAWNDDMVHIQRNWKKYRKTQWK